MRDLSGVETPGRFERNLPLVFGCVADPLRRRKIEGAFRDEAAVRWFLSFSALGEALESEGRRVLVTVLDAHDPTGAALRRFAPTLSRQFPGVAVVAYGHERHQPDDLSELAKAGVHDVLIEGVTDQGVIARAVVLDACRRAAADVVLRELRKILPARLAPFAEAVVRNPEKGSVEKIANHLGVHRQTPNRWCKSERYLRPEEVLIWSRLMLVATMLELPSRTLESIAVDLDYPSATSLRNQLKSYTGMTATQVRANGGSAVVNAFMGRVEQHRAGVGRFDSSTPDAHLSLRLSSAG